MVSLSSAASLAVGKLLLLITFDVAFSLRSVDTWMSPMNLKSVKKDQRELVMLCDTIGLQQACVALDLLRTLVPDNELVEEEPEALNCLPEGKLVFVHMMQSGGLSVDDFLQNSCSEHSDAACSVRRPDGARGFDGKKACEGPSICSSHAPLQEDIDVCGPSFKDAVHFTVMRNPVARVWSFYNYIRRWYVPWQTLTLKEVYLAMYKGQDLNEGLEENEMCLHCAEQLSNAMFKHNFAGRNKTMDAAKSSLRSMRVIIDMDALDRFKEIAFAYRLFEDLPALAGAKTQLEITHENSKGQRWDDHPDNGTEESIKRNNAEDLELYRYARGLSNYVV
mmetsp:Transcript_60682/g.131496  ORF Transcript_60682/g.131496 Transcript_60682/m.131496 type:complete len:335 (-) Transcript_60682:117-1121(-)